MAAVFKGHDDIALRIIRAGATPHIQDKVNLAKLCSNQNLFAYLTNRTKQMHCSLLLKGTRLTQLQMLYWTIYRIHPTLISRTVYVLCNTIVIVC